MAANAWQQVEWIAAEALNHLEDALVITQLTAKDKTAEFNNKPNGYAVGSTIDIRTNPVYTANEFAAGGDIVTQGIRSSVRSLSIEKLFDVSVAMSAREKRLDFDGFSEQVIKPAAYALAERCDTHVGTKILEAAGLYSSATLFGDANDMALAKQSATFQQLSSTGRFCLVNDTLEARLLGATYMNTFNSRGDSGERVFNEASMGRAMGMDFFSALNFPVQSHVSGTMICATNNTSGTKNLVGDSVLTVDTQTSGKNVKAGDRLKVAGVRRPLKVLTAIADTDATTSVVLADPINEIIPDNAAVTVVSSGATYDVMGAIFDDSSVAVAMPMLDPASDKPSFTVSSNGYSIRVVQGYDITKKSETMSLDILVGAKAYDPRRITLLGDNQ